MANWAPAFTLSALALATITFNNIALTHLSEIMVIIALVAASLANVLCAGHFVRDVFVYKVFTGAQPMGPLSFTKLTHEAFRCGPSHSVRARRGRGSSLTVYIHAHVCPKPDECGSVRISQTPLSLPVAVRACGAAGGAAHCAVWVAVRSDWTA